MYIVAEHEVASHVSRYNAKAISKSDHDPSLNLAPHTLLDWSRLDSFYNRRLLTTQYRRDAVNINAASVTDEMHNLPANPPINRPDHREESVNKR